VLIYPRQRYACIQCGKSCGHWRIWVEPELVSSLRAHPLALRLEVAGHTYLEPEAHGWFRLAYDPEGRCWFLQDGHLCGLHASTGWKSKPRACRQFPFFLLKTPEGYQVGLSFRCTAVQQNHGVEWSLHQPDLEDLIGSGQYPEVGFQDARVGDFALSWELYKSWEQGWRSLLEQGQTLSQAVWPELKDCLKLQLTPMAFESLLDSWAASAVALLEGDSSIATALQQGQSYLSPRWGEVAPQATAFAPPNPDFALRYLDHGLERKSLWLGQDFLAQCLMMLVAERMLRYYARAYDQAFALDRVEGEWMAHRQDLGPIESGLSQTLLQFSHRQQPP